MSEEKATKKQTLFTKRQQKARDLRENVAKFLRHYNGTPDGFAVSLVKYTVDDNGNSVMNYATSLSHDFDGIEAAADSAAIAVTLLKDRFDMDTDEAMDSFRTRVLERILARRAEVSAERLQEAVGNLVKSLPQVVLKTCGPLPKELLDRMPKDVAERLAKAFEERMKEPEKPKEPEAKPAPVVN